MLGELALTLIEATITLYPANASGEPILSSPIWMGCRANDFSAQEEWLVTETRPTGRSHPRRRPLIPIYRLRIGRVWTLPIISLQGFRADHQRHVLDVLWKDEDSSRWKRWTFYGVTIANRGHDSRDAIEMAEDQAFDAEFYLEDEGDSAIPAISGQLPYQLRWSGTDGTLLTHRYDPITHLWSEVIAGISTGRVTVAYVPDLTGHFDITFDGETSPALRVQADGKLVVEEFREEQPDGLVLPRLDWVYGTHRFASLSSQGVLYVPRLAEGTPEAGTQRFQLFSDSTLRSTVAISGVVTADYAEATL